MLAHVGPELGGLHHHERDVAVVRGRVQPDQRVDRRSVHTGRERLHALAEVLGQRDGVAHRPQAAAEQRDVDDRRLAGALPLEQRRGDAARQVGAGDGVAVGRSRRTDHARRAGRGDGGGGARAAPEGGHVVAALDRFLAAGSECAAPRVDDLRVDGADVVDVDTELLAVSGQEAGQEDVGALRELVAGLPGPRAPTCPARCCACRGWRARCWGSGSPSTRSGPVWRSPRCGSPVTACSTLMTSAPHSASTAPADGTKPYMATSRTRMPSSGLLLISRPPSRRSCAPGTPRALRRPSPCRYPTACSRRTGCRG